MNPPRTNTAYAKRFGWQLKFRDQKGIFHWERFNGTKSVGMPLFNTDMNLMLEELELVGISSLKIEKDILGYRVEVRGHVGFSMICAQAVAEALYLYFEGLEMRV